MKQRKIRAKWLRLTEKTNALDYLEKAYDFIRQTETSVLAWKWVILALHSALYGFAICACQGTTPDFVAPKIKKGKNKGKRQLINFNKALVLCQNPNWMHMTVDSKHLQLSHSQEQSICYLHEEFRNNFEHFSPKSWSIELHGMPQIAIDVLEVTRFLALDTGNYIHLTQTQMKRIKSIVFQSKRILKQRKLYKEAEIIKSKQI